MKIGKQTIPHTAICSSNDETITVRDLDLAKDLIGQWTFADYFYLLLTGKKPSAAVTVVLNAALVAIAEHGLVPSVQASRMTYAAAPESLQGAVAAGILGCGTVILGASEQAGYLLQRVKNKVTEGRSLEAAVREAIAALIETNSPIPGYGHPQHKSRDPRVSALFDVATTARVDQAYVEIAEAIESAIPSLTGKHLKMNVSVAIPAILLGAGFPLNALKGVPILARTAGLIAHLTEEQEQPIGFALSYQAVKAVVYDGHLPAAVAGHRQASSDESRK